MLILKTPSSPKKQNTAMRLFFPSLSKGKRYDILSSTIMIAIPNYPIFSHETACFYIREDEEQFL
ncbi:hypothetical protein [Anoxybacillus tengchongensis]|uniref:hypothetical protein n=1 Tax=Anoxybacillus tengchongensis TaxID=576944 RepID=UPI001C8590B7|nr:hypothetical protein [Anoxybacillus tengchongensis]